MKKNTALPILVPFSSGKGGRGLQRGATAFAEFLIGQAGGYREVSNHFFTKAYRIDISTEDTETIHEQLVNLFHQAYKHGTAPIYFGGDHGVSFYLLKAALSIWSRIALVVFDAHSDVQGSEKRLHNWNVLRMIKTIAHDAIKIVHIGFRDIDGQNLLENVDACYTMHDMVKTGIDVVTNKLSEDLNGYPVYISVDLDVLDPLLFPAVSSPISGGLLPQQLFFILESLKAKYIIGSDIVEYDHANANGREMIFMTDLFFHLGEICEYHNSVPC